MLTETLYCNNCGDRFVRAVKRGPKPTLCYSSWCRPVKKTRPASRNVELTDAGSVAWETRDCTVRAVALATGAPYTEAHDFMAQAGRKRGKGISFVRVLLNANYEVLGTQFEPVRVVRSKGLRTFLLRNPWARRGTYVLHSTHHVAVLKNGKLLDSFDSSRKVIDNAWKVSKV